MELLHLANGSHLILLFTEAVNCNQVTVYLKKILPMAHSLSPSYTVAVTLDPFSTLFLSLYFSIGGN